jgi:RND family efflux transporter MFP subunit
MKQMAVLLLIAAAFAGGWLYGHRSPAAKPDAGGRRVLYWVDPMHPAYKSDKPGIAPDCGMKLEPVYAEGGRPGKDNRPILYYYDPGDSVYRAQSPGLNPATGNDLKPFHAGDAPGSVQVNANQQQLIGLKYGVVERASGAQSLRAVGKIELDERLVSHVHSRTEGWIEEVYADFTGKYVKPGETLLTIYSPELVASQQEYLLALRARKLMQASSVTGTASDSDSMVDAARRRLKHWELSDEQIAELQRTGKVTGTVPLVSNHGGYIVDRKAFPHQKITPDMDLYVIADLSVIWIVADVYESDASQVKVGDWATVSLPYQQGRTQRAKVTYILPQVDPQTRTLKVRMEAANPGGEFKPEMFVDVDFDSRTAVALLVPADAVLDSGMKKTVFVALQDGYFEPRAVETGRRMGDKVEVLKGLRAGEKIVVSGNFLLDSESQLKAPAAGSKPEGSHDRSHH